MYNFLNPYYSFHCWYKLRDCTLRWGLSRNGNFDVHSFFDALRGPTIRFSHGIVLGSLRPQGGFLFLYGQGIGKTLTCDNLI